MAERKENGEANEVSLTFQAGQAFGSGFHPSTQAVLMAMDMLKGLSLSRILDMGCGSGVLALVAASWWPDAQIVAVDLEAQSVEVTLQNAAENGMGERVLGIRSQGFSEKAVTEHGPYDLMLCNLLPEPLMQMAADVASNLAPGGKVVLSGILQWLLPQVLEVYNAVGLQVVEEIPVKEWRAVVMERR